MTRKQAIRIFGNVRKTAEALDITVQAVYQWPEKGRLKLEQADRINGAAWRLGMISEYQ